MGEAREMSLRELLESLPRRAGSEEPTHRAWLEYSALVGVAKGAFDAAIKALDRADEAEAKVAELEGELELVRPVVHAALGWATSRPGSDARLRNAVRRYHEALVRADLEGGDDG